MSKDININVKSLPELFGRLGRKMVRYIPMLFFIVVALVYGFVLLRISSLAGAQPDNSTVAAEAAKLTPHIDKSAVKQLESLKDNSVNVQTLFSESRDNPFND
jgi:hypothetical protein